jgi:hypothetical protein
LDARCRKRRALATARRAGLVGIHAPSGRRIILKSFTQPTRTTAHTLVGEECETVGNLGLFFPRNGVLDRLVAGWAIHLVRDRRPGLDLEHRDNRERLCG